MEEKEVKQAILTVDANKLTDMTIELFSLFEEHKLDNIEGLAFTAHQFAIQCQLNKLSARVASNLFAKTFVFFEKEGAEMIKYIEDNFLTKK